MTHSSGAFIWGEAGRETGPGPHGAGGTGVVGPILSFVAVIMNFEPTQNFAIAI